MMFRRINILRASPWQVAIAASCAVHLLMLICIASSIWNSNDFRNHGPQDVYEFEAQIVSSDESTILEPSATDSNATDLNAQQVSAIAKSISIYGETNRVAPAAESWVASEIKRAAIESQNKSQDRNLNELSQLGERLARNSSEKSVDAMTGFLNGVLGNDRANVPAVAPQHSEAEFDISTAQMHDVKKVVDDRGNSIYTAVMIDAKGNASEIQLDADMGEQLYRTMKLIKSNPLLERVYRQMVMRMLDQILASSEDASVPNTK